MLSLLKGVTKLGDFSVVNMDALREQFPEKFNESGSMDYKWFEQDVRPHNFVYVREDVNSLAFTLQKGPVENGVNGCSISTIVQAVRTLIEKENEQAPNESHRVAIEALDVVLSCRKLSHGIVP